jgi:hypothetical protein
MTTVRQIHQKDILQKISKELIYLYLKSRLDPNLSSKKQEEYDQRIDGLKIQIHKIKEEIRNS